jgi:beta-glucanase (GH16 family)
MLRLGLLLSPLLLVAADPSCPLPGYAYAWGDEFEGAKLDEGRWEQHEGQRGPSMCRKQNVALRGGQLVLTGQNKGGTAYLPYSNAEVSSRRQFLYGYYEASLKVPEVRGWQTSFHAVDAEEGVRGQLEILSNDSLWPDRYRSQVSWYVPSKAMRPSSVVYTMDKQVWEAPVLSREYHVWGCEFTPEEVRIYFDGRLVGFADARPFPHFDRRIRLQVGVSSFLGSSPEAAVAEVAGHLVHKEVEGPAEACFDYVRFFARK